MDIQEIVRRQVKVMRNNSFRSSGQLTLGDLIDALKSVKDKKASVRFDFGYMKPKQIESWRGSYDELAINYSEDDDDSEKVSHFISRLNQCIGKTFVGYKGGDFVMKKNTPVWVANHGQAANTAIFGIKDFGYQVIIETGYCEF